MPETQQEYIHPELRNIASEFDEKALLGISQQCLFDFQEDLDSRAEWEEMHADWLRLYFQKDTPVNRPWEGSSTESMPMLVEGCHQFSARAFQAMFPNREFIKAIPVGKVDSKSRERANRIGTHMSWQLLVKDRGYKRNKDRLLAGIPLHGSVFTKAYYCPVRRRNVVDNVRAIDLVVPYGTGPREMEDLDRKTHIIRMPVTRTIHLAEAGYFTDPAKPYDNSDNSPVDDVHDQAEGNQAPLESGQAEMLEQHRYLDLDEDGIPEPYIVTLDRMSGKVLRLCIGYETDEAGAPLDRKEPVQYFTHYPFLENPDGFYGLGLGHLIAPLNTAVNKLLRQTIDAGTLANVGNQSGLISNTLSTAKGDLKMQLGKFVPVPGAAEDIGKGIFQFKFPGPNNVHLQVIEALMQRSDRLSTSTEAITGQTDKVMQPTAILALIEQSMQMYSAVYERILNSWELELDKLYRLNFKHMDPEEYFGVLDTTGAVKEIAAAREDYAPDMQVQPIADPKMASDRQKLAKAEAEYQFAMSNPLVVNSPRHLYNASRRYLEAIGSKDIAELLPEPSQEGMPQVDNPMQENVGALSPMPVMPPAAPNQDHLMHVQAHQALLEDPQYGAVMSDMGRTILTEHIQAHLALMYGVNENDGTGGLGLPGMGAPAGIPGAIAPLGGAVSPEFMEGGGIMGESKPI